MDASNLECSSSSGCESGWTTYFDTSTTYDQYHYNNEEFTNKYKYYSNENPREEDLSMVSDASSGPPNYEYHNNCDDEADQYVNYGYASSVSTSQGKKKKNQKSKTKEVSSYKVNNKQQNLGLDDTASSPVFHYSQDQGNVTPSNYPSLDDSNSMPKKSFGFFKSSTKGKSGSLFGKKRH